jgi:hypothetical protein
MLMLWKRSSDGEAEDRETVAVTAWMKELASLPVSEDPMPDATYLWWKGELLRRWDAQQKATELIEVGEQVQVGLSLLAAAGLLVWLWRTLPGIATSSTAGTSLTLGLILSAVLLAATAAVTVRDWIRGS